MTAPHCHTVKEAEGNIKAIEHNSSGLGPGPAGKHAGPPKEIKGGSDKNETAGKESTIGKEL